MMYLVFVGILLITLPLMFVLGLLVDRITRRESAFNYSEKMEKMSQYIESFLAEVLVFERNGRSGMGESFRDFFREMVTEGRVLRATADELKKDPLFISMYRELFGVKGSKKEMVTFVSDWCAKYMRSAILDYEIAYQNIKTDIDNEYENMYDAQNHLNNELRNLDFRCEIVLMDAVKNRLRIKSLFNDIYND